MLKPSDCKPGVEVIAIKNKPSGLKPPLTIGMIYTIYSVGYKIITGEILDHPVISLNEIDNRSSKAARGWGYYLDQFKLRDPFELDKLFNLDNIDKEVLREKEFENI